MHQTHGAFSHRRWAGYFDDRFSGERERRAEPPRKFWSIRVTEPTIAEQRQDALRELAALQNEISRRAIADHDRSKRRQGGPVSATTAAIMARLKQQPKRYQAALHRLYLDWLDIRARFFSTALQLPEIVVATNDQGALGRCHFTRRPIKIEIAPHMLSNYERDDLRGTFGVLLHETAHAFVGQCGGKYTPLDHRTAGHGEAFTTICNRIGKQLGLGTVASQLPTGNPRASMRWPLDTPKL